MRISATRRRSLRSSPQASSRLPGSASIADRIVHIRDGRVSAEQARAQPDSEEIVVARGGWLRVPEELLRRGGIGSRARARLAEHSVLIEGTEDVAEAEPEAPKPT